MGSKHPGKRATTDLFFKPIMRHDSSRDEGVGGNERGLAGLPRLGAQAAGLQRLQHAQNLVAAAPHAQVMHQLILKHPIGIDHEKAAQGDPSVRVRSLQEWGSA